MCTTEYISAFVAFIFLINCTCYRCNSQFTDIHIHNTSSSSIHSSHFIKDHNHSYEIVQPVIYHDGHLVKDSFYQNKHLESILIVIPTQKKKFLLKLHKNKDLIANSFIIKKQHSTGFKIKKPNKAENHANHCYYHGHIEDDLQSKVALSTCNGIRGVIVDEHIIYNIEPVKDSSNKSLHYWYPEKKGNLSFRCGNSHHNHTGEDIHDRFTKETLKRVRRSNQGPYSRNEYQNLLEPEVRGPYNSNDNTRYLELYLVADYSTYKYHQSGMESRMIDIANYVNMLYQPLNLYIALVGLEIWNKKDSFPIDKSNAENTLKRFLHYRMKRINPTIPNDNAQLLVGVEFPTGVVGKAPQGKICMHKSSGGVTSDHRGSTLTSVAMTVAHELGHNLGMEHDTDECVCNGKNNKCIMESTSGDLGTSVWSSCSRQALTDSFEQGMDYCLRNKPKSLYRESCGNGFVEEGEECDCGLPQVCKSKCCDPNTCRLKPNAACATGKCCDKETCSILPLGTVCRSKKRECDLDEYCSGKDEYCPKDVYVYNGSPCLEGASYCFYGECKTHTSQCRLLWGQTGEASNDICFTYNNVFGNESGNCGYNWRTEVYRKCEPANTRCGMLHCKHQNEKLMFWKDSLAHKFPTSFLENASVKYVCRAVILDVGLEMPDPGLVPDGAKCGENKLCFNQMCTSLKKLAYPDCPKGCNGHGICNSRGNCHCDPGYAPPTCDKVGKGGSVDSGSANLDKEGSGAILTAVFAIVLLVCLVVILVCAYRRRSQLKQWWSTKKNIKVTLPSAFANLPKLPKSRPPARTESFHKNRPVRPVPISKPTLTCSTNRNSQALITPVDIPSESTVARREKSTAVRPVSAIMAKDISNPVLQSTTNRTSVAFSDQNLTSLNASDIKGGLATTGRRTKLRRNHSDRPHHPPPQKPDERGFTPSHTPNLRVPVRSQEDNSNVSKHLLAQDDDDNLYMNTNVELDNCNSVDHNSNHALYHNTSSPPFSRSQKEKPPRIQNRALNSVSKPVARSESNPVSKPVARSDSNPVTPVRNRNFDMKPQPVPKYTQATPSSNTTGKPAPYKKPIPTKKPVNLNKSDSDSKANLPQLRPTPKPTVTRTYTDPTPKSENKGPVSSPGKPMPARRVVNPPASSKFTKSDSTEKDEDQQKSNDTESRKKIRELRQMFDAKR